MIESISIKNTVIGTEVNINKYTGEYWLDTVDFGQVNGTPYTFKFIDQIGETVYNTGIETRDITISGWVAGWNEAQVSALKLKLNHFINPKHLCECYANDKKIQFYPTASIRYGTTNAENNEFICKFVISGYCPNPLFTDKNEHTTLIAYTEKLFKFPLIIPKDEGILMGIRQPSLIGEVTNEGDFPTGYIIEFHALGRVVNPILTDIGSQQFVEINKEMQNGDIIVIDTREGSRRVYGITNGITENFFKYRNFDSSWLTLERGINYLRYNAEEGITFLEVLIRWEPGYLEVDV